MAQLFETTTINGMTLPNRFVRSATYANAASETGFVTPKLTNLMVQLRARTPSSTVHSTRCLVLGAGNRAKKKSEGDVNST